MDANNRLYVADVANNRVQIFTIGNPTATLTIPATSPYDVAVGQNTSEIWVTDFTSVSVSGLLVRIRIFRTPRS